MARSRELSERNRAARAERRTARAQQTPPGVAPGTWRFIHRTTTLQLWALNVQLGLLLAGVVLAATLFVAVLIWAL